MDPGVGLSHDSYSLLIGLDPTVILNLMVFTSSDIPPPLGQGDDSSRPAVKLLWSQTHLQPPLSVI